MTGAVRGPLLFLDVDGPLIPFGSPRPYPTYETDRPESRETAAHPLLPRLDPAHGPRLAALPCDVVWATTWTTDANECIGPRLGLPELAVVAWPDPSEADERDERDERAGLALEDADPRRLGGRTGVRLGRRRDLRRRPRLGGRPSSGPCAAAPRRRARGVGRWRLPPSGGVAAGAPGSDVMGVVEQSRRNRRSCGDRRITSEATGAATARGVPLHYSRCAITRNVQSCRHPSRLITSAK